MHYFLASSLWEKIFIFRRRRLTLRMKGTYLQQLISGNGFSPEMKSCNARTARTSTRATNFKYLPTHVWERLRENFVIYFVPTNATRASRPFWRRCGFTCRNCGFNTISRYFFTHGSRNFFPHKKKVVEASHYLYYFTEFTERNSTLRPNVPWNSREIYGSNI